MRSGFAALVIVAASAGCGGLIGGADGTDVAAEKASNTLTIPDATGQSSTSSSTAIDFSSGNDFFHNFGTNGRTCGTCHKADQGWSFTPAGASALPASDPLFLFDGSNCLAPGQANPNPSANSTALLRNGLIRVEIAIPATADYRLASYTDPFNCPSNPVSTKTLRMYRRPLPSANSAFLTTVMWDGREPSLSNQANDATLGHAQATTPLADTDRNSIVAFETDTYNAQASIGNLKLSNGGANGGSAYLLSTVAPGFFPGINDSLSPAFSPIIFTLYAKWEPGTASLSAQPTAAASIGRGEALFNSRTFTISGVRGLNDGPAPASFSGTCGTCHDTPNVGNHSKPLAIDIGVTAPSPVALDVSLLPTYTFRSGAQQITVTDPGRGLITGKFADLGKTKGPVLRALAARAPYFHNGSAPDLATLVNFYDARFAIGLSDGEKADLVAFLGAL
jgi:cytochrome c peroxidase